MGETDMPDEGLDVRLTGRREVTFPSFKARLFPLSFCLLALAKAIQRRTIKNDNEPGIIFRMELSEFGRMS
jgi:hypothetical protein